MFEITDFTTASEWERYFLLIVFLNFFNSTTTLYLFEFWPSLRLLVSFGKLTIWPNSLTESLGYAVMPILYVFS